MNSIRIMATWLFAVILFQVAPGAVQVDQAPMGRLSWAPGPVTAWADESWKQEFEDVCARAGVQEGLSTDDLKALLARCDALKTAIEGLEESTRKVYLSRLQACRDLFRYMLDAKEKGGGR